MGANANATAFRNYYVVEKVCAAGKSALEQRQQELIKQLSKCKILFSFSVSSDLRILLLNKAQEIDNSIFILGQYTVPYIY